MSSFQNIDWRISRGDSLIILGSVYGNLNNSIWSYWFIPENVSIVLQTRAPIEFNLRSIRIRSINVNTVCIQNITWVFANIGEFLHRTSDINSYLFEISSIKCFKICYNYPVCSSTLKQFRLILPNAFKIIYANSISLFIPTVNVTCTYIQRYNTLPRGFAVWR